MRSVYLSGLSPRFQGLSRSSWAGCLRITHPFASISVQQAGLLSIDLHVLGTPPAFILSQDQTLHLISSSIVTAYRCLSCINLLTFVVSCNVSISCSVFKELPHCPFEQCSMSISSSRFLCQHVFLAFFISMSHTSLRPIEYTLFSLSLQVVFLQVVFPNIIKTEVFDIKLHISCPC